LVKGRKLRKVYRPPEGRSDAMQGAPSPAARTTIGVFSSSHAMTRLAKRTDQVMPFYAVEVFKQASVLNAQGRDIISLGIGEPDFTAPAQVVETLNRAASAGLSGYTAPAGLPALREAIAHYYGEHFDAPVDPGRVVVTSGASGALRSEERRVGQEYSTQWSAYQLEE